MRRKMAEADTADAHLQASEAVIVPLHIVLLVQNDRRHAMAEVYLRTGRQLPAAKQAA